MCEARAPNLSPPSLAAVVLSVAFGQTWLNSQGLGVHAPILQSLHPVDLS